MPEDSWDPVQYARFRDERRQPFFDLLGLVRPRQGLRIVDLGCGGGELTQVLHRRLGAAETLGIDSSAAMLRSAAAMVEPGLGFAQADIQDVAGDGCWDLVFSNAALHWLPAHPALFTRLTAMLAPGGQLAVQMPANFDHPAHRLAAEVAGEAPFAAALGGWTGPERTVLEPVEYAVLLHRLGYGEQHVRLQVYGHRLAACDEVAEWVKGTLLTAYRTRLGPPLHDRFVARYRERLHAVLEDARPYFFTFKRLLLWGERPA